MSVKFRTEKCIFLETSKHRLTQSDENFSNEVTPFLQYMIVFQEDLVFLTLVSFLLYKLKEKKQEPKNCSKNIIQGIKLKFYVG